MDDRALAVTLDRILLPRRRGLFSMSNCAIVCPGCSKPLPNNSTVCPTCDDARPDAVVKADDAYNRSVNLWMRAIAVVAALIAVMAVRATGRRPVAADYILMLVVEIVSAVAIWGFLKWKYKGTRRYLWRTALIPSFIVVALVFTCRAAGTRAGPAEAAAAPLSVVQPAIRITPTEPLIPLVRMTNECFTFVEAQAKAAGNETSTANLPAMFTLKPASAATVKTNRLKLKSLDARLVEFDSAIRQNASGLAAKIEASKAPAQVKAMVLSAVRKSGTELVQRCRESIAHQRRLVQQTDAVLAFMEPRFKRLSTKAQTSFGNRADQAAFAKLVKQFDQFEETSTMLLRRIHQRCDQSKQQLLVALTLPGEQPQASPAPR